MQIKMIATAHRDQKDMVLHGPSGKTYAIELGQTVEVGDADGAHFLHRWPKVLKLEGGLSETKQQKHYENKAVTSKSEKAAEKKDDILK